MFSNKLNKTEMLATIGTLWLLTFPIFAKPLNLCRSNFITVYELNPKTEINEANRTNHS